jgi:hypothetical protein
MRNNSSLISWVAGIDQPSASYMFQNLVPLLLRRLPSLTSGLGPARLDEWWRHPLRIRGRDLQHASEGTPGSLITMGSDEAALVRAAGSPSRAPSIRNGAKSIRRATLWSGCESRDRAPCCAGSTRTRTSTQRPCWLTQRGVMSISATFPSQCSTISGTSPE